MRRYCCMRARDTQALFATRACVFRLFFARSGFGMGLWFRRTAARRVDTGPAAPAASRCHRGRGSCATIVHAIYIDRDRDIASVAPQTLRRKVTRARRISTFKQPGHVQNKTREHRLPVAHWWQQPLAAYYAFDRCGAGGALALGAPAGRFLLPTVVRDVFVLVLLVVRRIGERRTQHCGALCRCSCPRIGARWHQHC